MAIPTNLNTISKDMFLTDGLVMALESIADEVG